MNGQVEDSVALARELLEARSALAFVQSVAPIATFSFSYGSQVAQVTPSLRALWAIPPEITEIHFADIMSRIDPSERAYVLQTRNEAVKTRLPYHVEYSITRYDGQVRRVRVDAQFFYDRGGNPTHNVGAVVDVTDQMHAQTTIEHLLGHDKLTGLLDRDRFIERVRTAAQQGREQRFVVLIFDLVGFGEINERFGMSAGDALLSTVAERLRAIEGPGECFARIGGDEFAGLLRAERSDADAVVARVQNALGAPLKLEGMPLRPEATFGMSLFPFDATDESLVVKASLAMAQLKSRGARGTQRYQPEMERMHAERRHLQMSLHSALDRDEFELYYQPIVDGKSLAMVGAEALIRWNHPSLGIIPPGAFLPAAEDALLLQAIDEWVLRHVTQEAAAFHKRRNGLRVAFNLTAHSLLSPKFGNVIRDVLGESGTPRDVLVAEITEQALLADHVHALASLTALRDAGVSIALDDFGTGYNTLSYLRMYPIETIKIDRSFISDLERYPYSRSVCSGILALASELGLHVVAEGVETEGQQEFLRSLGCELLQGYLYGRPMPRADFLQLLGNRRHQASRAS